MDKILHTWSLMGASWQIFKKDKEVMVFPLISAMCTVLVMVSFVLPLHSDGSSWRPPAHGAPMEDHLSYYGLLFGFYFCNYLVAVFFNSAIVACASIRMGGGDPTVVDGLKAAANRFLSILGWAFIMTTFGLFLRFLEDRSNLLGKVIAGLLGISWALASFLVVPILINEGLSPMGALFESAALLKKTWGEQLAGNFSFGLIFTLLSIPAIAAIVLLLNFGSGFLMIFGIVLAVEYLIVLGLIQSALQAIFQTAVYQYLQNNKVPPGFDSGLLESSIRIKN
jgi:hypothetical protein